LGQVAAGILVLTVSSALAFLPHPHALHQPTWSGSFEGSRLGQDRQASSRFRTSSSLMNWVSKDTSARAYETAFWKKDLVSGSGSGGLAGTFRSSTLALSIPFGGVNALM
jgi:hypothetical protein